MDSQILLRDPMTSLRPGTYSQPLNFQESHLNLPQWLLEQLQELSSSTVTSSRISDTNLGLLRPLQRPTELSQGLLEPFQGPQNLLPDSLNSLNCPQALLLPLTSSRLIFFCLYLLFHDTGTNKLIGIWLIIWRQRCPPSAYVIGRQAGRESVCNGSGRRGLSGPSERESEWWGASDGGDSSEWGGSLKKNTTEEETERNHQRRKSTNLNVNISQLSLVWNRKLCHTVSCCCVVTWMSRAALKCMFFNGVLNVVVYYSLSGCYMKLTLTPRISLHWVLESFQGLIRCLVARV